MKDDNVSWVNNDANVITDSEAELVKQEVLDGVKEWIDTRNVSKYSAPRDAGLKRERLAPAAPVPALAPAPTTASASALDQAYGIAKTNTLLFFTGKSSSTGKDSVFGVDQYGGPVFNVAPGLSKPRGLAWDGDNTMYVADEGKNHVWSMPAGRLVASAPVSKVVEFSGAYGVALISRGDPGFTLMTGASAFTAVLAPALQLMLVALTAAGLRAA
ncbi:unnamed protein product [Prorocentrum cordatum]|uniref:SMP-30/Gluconolactonase/LRE-like region domain-containing protein n=1 Tax=Prorocentrum cordatum TaxID=2364126 RepID=A0ABN9UQ41_9DINO|nr:unnamed protein product [Polarella glacialis]